MTSFQHRILTSRAIIDLIAQLGELEELRERVRQAEHSARVVSQRNHSSTKEAPAGNSRP